MEKCSGWCGSACALVFVFVNAPLSLYHSFYPLNEVTYFSKFYVNVVPLDDFLLPYHHISFTLVTTRGRAKLLGGCFMYAGNDKWSVGLGVGSLVWRKIKNMSTYYVLSIFMNSYEVDSSWHCDNANLRFNYNQFFKLMQKLYSSNKFFKTSIVVVV